MMQSSTIYDNQVTNNDVLLLPTIFDRMDPVDLSSIVEGNEEHGDDAVTAFPPFASARIPIPSSASRGMNMNISMNMNMNMNMNTIAAAKPISCGDALNLEKDFLERIGDIGDIGDMFSADDSDLKTVLNDVMPDPLPNLPIVKFASDKHPGNNRFYVLVRAHRKAYLEALNVGNLSLCEEIAQKIVNKICYESVPNGRFLECTHETWSQSYAYNNLNPGSSIDIVKWALREPPKAEIADYFQKKKDDIVRPKVRGDIDKIVGDFTKFQATSQRTTALDFDERLTSLGTNSEDDFEDRSSNPGSASSKSSSNYHSGSFTQRSSWTRRSRGRKRNGSEPKKDTTLKRRGTISSNEAIGNKKRGKKINLADIRFSVSKPLSKLVEEVFSPPIRTETTAFSETSEPSRGGASIISGIGHIGLHDTRSADGGANGVSTPEGQEPIKVRTTDGAVRNLGQYDVLCDANLKLHVANHIGNNRFRIMLQMNKRTFHNQETSPKQREEIGFQIAKQVMNGEKGKGKFVQENLEGFWLEISDTEVPNVILQFLQQCANDAGLSLPTIQQASSRSLTAPLQNNNDTYKHSQFSALQSIKSKKNKNKYRGRTDDDIVRNQKRLLQKHLEGEA